MRVKEKDCYAEKVKLGNDCRTACADTEDELTFYAVVRLCNVGEIAAASVRPVRKLAILVVPCGPYAAVLLEHHAVTTASSHRLYAAGDNLHEHSFEVRRPIAELPMPVVARDPHTAILSQHHTMGETSSHILRAREERLHKTPSIRYRSNPELTIDIPP